MYDCVIIGAGPAGLSAGLYAGRFRLNTVILEKYVPGGQIILSPTIENFPGFPGGIATDDLIARCKQQIDDVGVALMTDEAVEVTPGEHLFRVRLKSAELETRTIICATGAQWKHLGVEGEERLIGRGVSYCGTCDGPLFRGKEIVVVGGGDRAIEDALFLTRYASRVTIVHRRQEFRAATILVEHIRRDPRICFILDSVVEKIEGAQLVEKIIVRNLKTNAVREIPAQGIFIFVGIKPNTEFLRGLVQTNESGFIITDTKHMTSLKGVFACGDCCQKSLYQVISACAEGAASADAAHKYLLAHGTP